ncbi:DUF2497 domain-containing protein [Ancylobacter crimeensis]
MVSLETPLTVSSVLAASAGVETASAQPPAAEEPDAPATDAPEDARLLSPQVMAQAGAAFAELNRAPAAATPMSALPLGSRTLDDVVVDLLRPMLREWLDQNLTPLVERLVRAEIERIARGGR